MTWVDYAILGLIGISALISLMRGFVREFISLATWFAAFLIASHFSAQLAVYFTAISDPTLRQGAAILALFIATLVLGGLINYIVGQLVDKTGLSSTDRVLGLVFGALRGVLIVAALLFFFDAFTPLSQNAWWQDSTLIPHFKVIIRWFFNYLGQHSSLLQTSIS